MTETAQHEKYNTAKFWQIGLFGVTMSATNIHMMFIGGFLMVYATESFLVAAATIGLLMTVTRIFDAFTDPIIGLWIDKTDTKLGRFRPWMIAGSIIINICLIAMFWGVNFESQIARFIWIAVWYVIWVIGYTFHTACNKGGATVLTNNPKQRPLVGGVGFIATVGVQLIIFSQAIPFLMNNGGMNNLDAWRQLAIYVALLSTFLTTLAVIGIWKKDNRNNYSNKDNAEKRKLHDYVSIIKTNKPLQMLIVAASTNKIAQQCMSASMVYFFMIVVNNVEIQPIISKYTIPLGIVGTALGIFLAVKFSNKVSFVVGSWLSIAVGGLILLIRPFDPSQLTLFVILLAASALLNSWAGTNINPMIADITDYENWKNGRFMPGMISTAFSFIDKFVSSFASILVGAIIGAASYVSGMEVSSSLYWGMITVYLGIPVLGHIASVIAMKYYEIDRDLCEKISSELQERNNMTSCAS